MVDSFKPMDHRKQKLKANRIACFQNGDIVVADNYEHHCRYILSRDKEYKATLTSPYPYVVNYISSIIITTEGYIAFVDWTTIFVTIFNKHGKFVNRFQAAVNEPDHNLTGVAADQNGDLVVWDSQQCLVTWYSCPDGRRLKQIKVDEKMQELPQLAVNSAQQLIFYDDSVCTGNNKVIAMNNTGRELFSISPQIGERSTGKTYTGMEVGLCGLVTGEDDEIFIAMKVCIPNIGRYSGRIGKSNTGHIHRYDNKGEFQQCIIRGLHSPHDLAMTSDGALIVANDDSILKYCIEPALVEGKAIEKLRPTPGRSGMDRYRVA